MVACRGHGWWRCSVGLFTMSSSSKQKPGDLEVTRVKDAFVTNKRSQFFTSEEAIFWHAFTDDMLEAKSLHMCKRDT